LAGVRWRVKSGKAPRQRWHLRQRWRLRIHKLQIRQGLTGLEFHPLRQLPHLRFGRRRVGWSSVTPRRCARRERERIQPLPRRQDSPSNDPMRWARRFLCIDRAHDGRERQGPALDGRLFRRPRLRACSDASRLRRSPLRGLDTPCARSNDGYLSERTIIRGLDGSTRWDSTKYLTS